MFFFYIFGVCIFFLVVVVHIIYVYSILCINMLMAVSKNNTEKAGMKASSFFLLLLNVDIFNQPQI